MNENDLMPDLPTAIFTESELGIIRMLLVGKSNMQIASELGIVTRTVEFHLTNIYKKLDVSCRGSTTLKRGGV